MCCKEADRGQKGARGARMLSMSKVSCTEGVPSPRRTDSPKLFTKGLVMRCTRL